MRVGIELVEAIKRTINRAPRIQLQHDVQQRLPEHQCLWHSPRFHPIRLLRLKFIGFLQVISENPPHDGIQTQGHLQGTIVPPAEFHKHHGLSAINQQIAVNLRIQRVCIPTARFLENIIIISASDCDQQLTVSIQTL